MRYGAICIGLAGPAGPTEFSPKYYSFLLSQANTDASSTEMVKKGISSREHKCFGMISSHGTILCAYVPRSCPLDKLAGYLRNLIGKELRRKHR